MYRQRAAAHAPKQVAFGTRPQELSVGHGDVRRAAFAEGRNNLFADPMLSAIAGVHGASVAQVVLRWLIQRGVVAIPKSVQAERMAQNFDIFEFELTEGDMAQIAGLDTGASLFFDHRDPAMVSRLGGLRRE